MQVRSPTVHKNPLLPIQVAIAMGVKQDVNGGSIVRTSPAARRLHAKS